MATLRNALISILFLSLTSLAACGNGPGPNPGCEEDNSCPPLPCEETNTCTCEDTDTCPPPPPDVKLDEFSVSHVETFEGVDFPEFASNGQTYLMGQTGTADQLVLFDLAGSRIDSMEISSGSVASVNGLFGQPNGYTVSTRNFENNAFVGRAISLNNAGEVLTNATDLDLAFNDSTQTVDGEKFMARGQNTTVSLPEGGTENIGELIIAKVGNDLKLEQPRQIVSLNGELISTLSVKIAASGNKLLVTTNRFTTIAPTSVFLYDIAADTVTGIAVPSTVSNEQISQLIGVADGWLVVMNQGSGSSPRSLHKVLLDGTVESTVIPLPPGRNLIPIKNGYLTSFANEFASSFDIVVQRLDATGTIVETFPPINGGRSLISIPHIELANDKNLLISWRWEDVVNGLIVRNISIAFLQNN